MRVVIILSVCLYACAAPPTDEGRTEAEPEAEPDLVLKRGTLRCAPRSVTGYQSGHPSAITVIEVDGKPVEVATANAYVLMREAAARDGVELAVVSGFRSHAEQSYLYRCYVDCACNNCNLAAYPGYSNHQSGLALDLNTAAPGVLRWLNRNAADFGFYRTVPSEDWHWEYLGPSPGEGPCPDGVPADRVEVAFYGLRDGGAYRNGFWLKAEADPEVHHVRYFADGWRLGASEDRGARFPVRVNLGQLGNRQLEVRGYDALDRPVAEARVRVQVTEGEAFVERLQLESPDDGGWYRNGLWLKAAPRPGVTRVDWYAGEWPLDGSEDADGGFAVRATFGTLGYRTLRAEAFGVGGERVTQNTVTVRVLPGDDAGRDAAVAFLAPTDGESCGRRCQLRVVGSDRVAAVEVSADGWSLGRKSTREGVAEWAYAFQKAGPRALEAVGLDAEGRVVARDHVEIEVRD